jgi:hypothetical protein
MIAKMTIEKFDTRAAARVVLPIGKTDPSIDGQAVG